MIDDDDNDDDDYGREIIHYLAYTAPLYLTFVIFLSLLKSYNSCIISIMYIVGTSMYNIILYTYANYVDKILFKYEMSRIM
jgi:hypothetical protein